MTSVATVINPYEMFRDRDGSPLENGYVYVGTSGTNPEILANQLAIFSDSDTDIPVSQPIRTLGGVPIANGSIVNLQLKSSDYSITIRDRNKELIYTSLSLALVTPATSVMYTPGGSGAVSVDIETWLRRDHVWAEDFGAIGYSTKALAKAGQDNKTAIDAALATGKVVRFQDLYYGTTGDHSLSTDTQGIIGSGRRNYTNDESGTVIVRLSGTTPMFKRNNQIGGLIASMTLDGDSVNAVLVEDLVCFYARMFDVEFKGCGSSSGALNLDRNNLNTYHNLFFDDNHTHIKASTFAGPPVATNLNCDFYNVTLALLSNGFSDTGKGILIEGGVSFNFFGLRLDDYCPIKIAPTAGFAVDNINFFGLQFENDNDGTATDPYIELNNSAGTGVRNINFYGVRGLRSSTTNTQDLWSLVSAINVNIKDVHIEDKVESACNVVALNTVSQYRIEDLFYINSQTAGAIDVDIVDNTGAASNDGVVKNIRYSGPQTTGKIKVRGSRKEIALSNCQVSFNGTSAEIKGWGLTLDFDQTNLSTWVQDINGYQLSNYNKEVTTTAALADVTASINTGADKIEGKKYLNTNTGIWVVAAGNADVDVWVYEGTGNTAHTPV